MEGPLEIQRASQDMTITRRSPLVLNDLRGQHEGGRAHDPYRNSRFLSCLLSAVPLPPYSPLLHLLASAICLITSSRSFLPSAARSLGSIPLASRSLRAR